MTPSRCTVVFAWAAGLASLGVACARGAEGGDPPEEPRIAAAEAGAPDAGDAASPPRDGGLRDVAVPNDAADAADAAVAPDGGGVPRVGLVAEWLFTGNTADTSGRGHDGVGVDVTLVPDRHGKAGAAGAFNGRTSYVQVPGSPDLDLRGAFSVSAWVRPQSFGWLRGIVSKYRSPNARGFTLRLNHVPPYDGIDFLESAVSADAGATALTAGAWQHVVATANGRSVTLWVNGVIWQSSTAGYDATSNGDALGIGTDYTDRFFDGVIDDVRLYTRELRAGDVAALYAER